MAYELMAPGEARPSRQHVANRSDNAPLSDDLAGLRALHRKDRTGRSQRMHAKDLIGLLFCHGARLRRLAMPRLTVEVHALAPSGRQSVEIRL